MGKKIIKKITNLALVICLLSGQALGQVAATKSQNTTTLKKRTATTQNSALSTQKKQELLNLLNKDLGGLPARDFILPAESVHVADNTRIVSPSMHPAYTANASLSLTSQLLLDFKDLDTTRGINEFSALANAKIDDLLKAVGPISSTFKENRDIIFEAVLPKIYHFAVLENGDNYYKITKIYIDAYEACIKGGKNAVCSSENAGKAAFFLASNNFYEIKIADLAKFLQNNKLEEDEKIAFIQYAGPIMAQNGGRIYFDDIIKNSSNNSTVTPIVNGGYIDPFVLVNLFDDGYKWVRNACSHEKGFWKGACATWTSDKPFKEYQEVVRPPVLDKIVGPLPTYGTLNLQTASFGDVKFNEPAFLASTLRIYAELYGDDFYWYDTFKYLYNLSIRTNKVIAAHLDIALAKLVLNPPDDLRDINGLKNYMAAKINNHYFIINQDSDIDANLKAFLKNELGSVYAALKGYKGQSPLVYTSDEGFEVKVAFVNNEEQIESFFGSLFNFKERPGEATANLFIVGLLTKGIAKNGDKIFTGITRLFKSAGRAFNNMPAIIAQTKAHYRALQHLSAQSGMSLPKYAYRNSQYKKAVANAAKGNLLTVEGKATGEFFKSAAYNPQVHGNIARINRDIKQASNLGIQHLGKGGTIPSYVSTSAYNEGLTKYTHDLLRQEQVTKAIAEKYKTAITTVGSGAKAKVAEPLLNAQHLLPRSYMYSFDKSRFLFLAQNNAFSKSYIFGNQVYQGLGQRGYVFFDTKTKALFGKNLAFHPEGYLQAQSRIGVTKLELAKSFAAPLSSPASDAALENVVKAHNKMMATITSKVMSMVYPEPASRAFIGGSLSAAKTYMAAVPAMKLVSTDGVLKNNWKYEENRRSLMRNLKPQGLSPADYALSTFKIVRPDGNSGSGALINHRGLRVILTSAHVVGDDNKVEIFDLFGRKTIGHVLNSMVGDGFDIAAVRVDDNYLSGRTPFKIASKEPRDGDVLLHHGYPLLNLVTPEYRTSLVEVLNHRFMPPNAPSHTYLTTIGDITYGSSGGPLSYGSIQDKIVGITHGITQEEDKAIFLALPKIRDFMTNTVRRILFEEPLNTSVLPLYPELSASYRNVIGQHERIMAQQNSSGNNLPSISHSQFISSNGIGSVPPSLRLVKGIGELENSIIKIVKKGDTASTGTGFFVSYRGFPFILSASHVPDEKSVVQLLDNKAILGFGTVFAKTGTMNGRDLSIIIPNRGFLEDKVPFELSLKEPKINDALTSYGYPGDDWLRQTNVTLKRLPNLNEPFYSVAPGVYPGTSGGPLLSGGNKVVGVAHKSHILKDANDVITNIPESYFITLPVIKSFLSSTLKRKFLDTSFNQREFLSRYPGLAKNYANLLQRYSLYMGTQNYAVDRPLSNDEIIERLSDFGDYNPIQFINFIPATPSYIENFQRIRAGVFEVENLMQGSSGTGFYVKWGNDEALIGAGHSSTNSSTVRLRPQGTDKWFTANVAGRGRGAANDISLFEMPDKEFWNFVRPLTPSTGLLHKGDRLVAYGFPWSASFEDRVGIFAEYSFTADGPVIITSENTAPGSSGGPLLFNNLVVGMSVRGFTQEEVNKLSWFEKRKTKALSEHLPWANIERFLNIMKLWTLPPSLRMGVDYNDQNAVRKFLMNRRPIFLNPRDYGIKIKQPVIYINPYEQYTEFGFENNF